MRAGEKRGVAYYPRILVLGDTGFFGKNLRPILEERYPHADIIFSQGSKFFDLTQAGHVRALFGSITDNHGAIHIVINLAGLSGGMFSNMESPATYWYVNNMIITNVIERCAFHKVQKLIMPIGGCSYPDESVDGSGIFKEEDLWSGFPNRNSFGYSMAKKQAIIAGMCYEDQFGLKSHVVIPTNPIGPWDNADENNAHVPMALIKRFVEAVDENFSAVTVYGDGTPERDFLYIEDIVKLLPEFISYGDGVGPINISSGKGTSIAELAEIIARVVGFDGKIIFDTTKPNGQQKKILDNKKLLEFLEEIGVEWEPTPIEEAIGRTVEWYRTRVWRPKPQQPQTIADVIAEVV
jgi:GDP-L-fucose synthase